MALLVASGALAALPGASPVSPDATAAGKSKKKLCCKVSYPNKKTVRV